MKLDRLDKQILAALQRDGRLSNRELAEHVHLSESACLRRMRALEEAGVIDRYVALVNQAKVGLPGNVFVSITLNRQEQADLAAFEEAVKRVPEVMECYLMTGQQDTCCASSSPIPPTSSACTASTSRACRVWRACNRASPCVPYARATNCRCGTSPEPAVRGEVHA